MSDSIVITGFSGRFPQSDNLDQLRDNLFDNKDLISEGQSRWPTGFYGLTNRGGRISGLEKFDAQFFRFYPEYTNKCDPLLRILLENAVEAILDSGTTPECVSGSRTGVFIGASTSEAITAFAGEGPNESGLFVLGCETSQYANRISYCLNLRGPSLAVQTACSSAGTALHQAILNIRNGVCDAALVGGSNLNLHPKTALSFSKLGILSADGKCKFLDERADGYVRSESCAMMFIQKASHAKRIYATLINIRANTDGYKEQGITYPSAQTQRSLMEATLNEANVDPNDVLYVEAHGTATQAGDSQEMDALSGAYCQNRSGPLLVGSVKTNLGHSEAGSCMAAIAKTLITFENRRIPATLHFERPNTQISALMSGAIRPVTENTDFSDSIVAIDSFGFGGANVHFLLKPNTEDPNATNNAIVAKIPRIIPLFGRTEQAVNHLAHFIEQHPNRVTNDFLGLLSEIKHTSGMNYRSYIMANHDSSAESGIAFHRNKLVVAHQAKRPLWFIFPGMGCEWAGFASGLMDVDVIRESLHSSAQVLKEVQFDLNSLLNQPVLDDIVSSLTSITLTQMALIDLFRALDIVPDGMVGHSLGELACAYCDGGMDRRKTLLSNYWRAKLSQDLCQEIGSGMMAVVGMSWDECLKRCPTGVHPACHNSQDLLTISGGSDAVKRFITDLRRDNIYVKEVNSYGIAFHSPYVEEVSAVMMAKTANIVDKPKLRSPKWISSSVPESQWDTEWAKYCSSQYFQNNMSSPVLFYEALQHIPRNAIVVEIAPHPLFAGVVKRTLGPDVEYLSLMKRNNSSGNLSMLLAAIGRLYQLGLNPNINKLYPRVSYPVSRGTQSIGSLIKWDHTMDWFVPLYPDHYNPADIPEHRFIFDLSRSEHKFYCGHRVDGRILFPTTGYVVMVWRLIAVINNKNVLEMSITFENLKIHHATVMDKDEKTTLFVRIGKNNDFSIRNSSDIVVTGRYVLDRDDRDNGDHRGNDKLNAFANCAKMKLKRNDCYKEFRIRGFEYGNDFQGISEVSVDGRMAMVDYNDNMVVLLDTILQVCILSEKHRRLLVPVSFQSIKLNMKRLNSSREGAKHLRVHHDPRLKLVWTDAGITIRYNQFNVVNRKHESAILEKYKYRPHDFQLELDELDEFINTSERLTQALIEKEKCLNNELDKLLPDDKRFNVLEAKYESSKLMYHAITDRNINAKTVLENVYAHSDIDLLMVEQFFTNENIIRPLIDLAIENLFPRKIGITEFCFDPRHSMSPQLKSFLDKSFLNLNVEFSLAMPEHQNNTESDVDTISWDPLENILPPNPGSIQLSIYKHPLTSSNKLDLLDITALCKYFYDFTVENGFLLCIFRTKLIPTEIYIHDLLEKNHYLDHDPSFMERALQIGFTSIATQTYSEYFSVVLFRKLVPKCISDQTFISVRTDTFEPWIETLKSALKECETKPVGHNLWLIADDSPHNGVIGLVNCLRREPNGQRIRCLFITEKKSAFEASLYSDIIAKDLVINVVKEGKCGSYRHLTCNEELFDGVKDCPHAYLNVSKVGDLSSIKWFEAEHKNWPIGRTADDNLIDVYYSGLNFKDIMLASGRLSADFGGGQSATLLDCLLGYELAGIDQTGRRVMGIVASKSLATTAVVHKTHLICPVPDHWSLEEAATVPMAYTTAFYALVIRGRLKRGETVLIHTGSGAVGQAAIRISLSFSCRVFTTVGNEQKKDSLTELFPQLSARCFATSRDTSFENHILLETKGRGVDLVLNSLAEDRLQASVRCLAVNGRFLEIGKYDMSVDNALAMSHFLKNIEFHGILLENLMQDTAPAEQDRKQLAQLITQGIAQGSVVPIKRIVYDVKHVEQAFRLMASGKHIGKVVIRIRDEHAPFSVNKLVVNAIPRTIFSPIKSYIIVGGLGGFGLELIQWMIEKGARHMVVNTRTSVKSDYQKMVIDRLIQVYHANIALNNFDGADEGEAEKLINLASGMGELGGVFNLALVLKDAMFLDQTEESFEQVCRPKIAITTNLDRLTRTHHPNIDYFVVFSSLASVRGNASQTNYGWANSAVERVCESRRADGLHGLAIQWGIIGDVGYVSDTVGTAVELDGLRAQRIHTCLQVLDRMLHSNEPVLTSYVTTVRKSHIKSGNNLVQKLANILGIKDKSTIDMNRSLAEMGIDSLISAEISCVLAEEGLNLSPKAYRELTINEIIGLSK